MAKQIFANGASSLLAASISDIDLTIQVQNGFGVLFPNPGADEYFIIGLENANGDREFVKITSRATDLLTVPVGGRGQEGTSAQAWTNGQTRVELRLTSGTLDLFIQRGGDTMDGDLDMDNNQLKDARLTGSTVVTGGQTVATAIRGALNDTSNEVLVPNDGSKATSGGQIILTSNDLTRVRAAAFVSGMISLWFGAIMDIPAGWKLCDGANGTPDMRNRFPIGSGTDFAFNSTGGASSGETNSTGGHTHTTTSGPHTLTVAEMPAHGHRFFYGGSGNDGGGLQDNYTTITSSSPQYQELTQGGAAGNRIIEQTGGGGAHSHGDGTTDTAGAHTHTVATLPPYRALHFIMYTG